MPGLFDDVAAPEFYGRQAVIPNAPKSQNVVVKSQPQGSNKATQIVEDAAGSILPSGFNQARNEPNVLKSTGYFLKGLFQSAAMIPVGVFNVAKSLGQEAIGNVKDIATGHGFDKAITPHSELTHSIDQGYKESGLSGAFLTGLSQTLPFLAILGGTVDLPANAKPSQVAETFLTGNAKGSTPTPEQVKVLEAPASKLPTEEVPVKPGTEAVSNGLDQAMKDQVLRDNTPAQPASFTGNFSSVADRLENLGPAGRELLSQISKYFEQPGLKAGEFTADLIPKLQGMTQEQLSNLKDVMQGKSGPIDPTVEAASNLARAQTDIIANLAKKNIPGFNPIQNYFTQSLLNLNELSNKQIVAETIHNMVNVDKTVGSAAEASALLDSWKTYLQKGELTKPLIDYVKKTNQIDITDPAGFQTALQTKLNAFTKPSFKFGPFESRSLNLPFYDPNPVRVLPKYFNQSFEFLHKLEQWGPSGQKLYDLVNLIGEHGGRNTDAQFATNVVDFLVKGDTADGAIRILRDNLLKYNAATKMPLSFISNSFQGFLGTAMYGDLQSALKMITKFRDPENIDFGTRAGGVGGTRLQRALSGTFGADVSQGLTSKILKPFTITEVGNYYQSIMGGRLFLENIADRLKANVADKFSIRKLSDMGFNSDEIAAIAKDGFTDEQMKLGALRFWKKSQAIPDFLNTPEFMQSGWGKILSQFKGVAYNQSRNIWTGVFKELKAGNPYPLIILATIFPAVGEIIGDVKTVAKGQNPFGDKGHSLLAHPSIDNYFADLSDAFGLGMVYDLYTASKDSAGFTNYWAGPSFQNVSHGLNSLYKTTSQGKPDLLKWTLDQVPFLGKPLENTFMPSKASAATLKQDMAAYGQSAPGKVLTKADAQRFADNPIPGVTQTAPGIAPTPKKGVIGNVDITNYATDPGHEKRIAQIYSNVSAKTPQELTAYIQKRAPKSPITGQMIFQASQTYGIDPKLITAIIQNDSGFGTKGKGARGFNPGNVGNNDRGQTIKYTNWQEGVNAVARFLSKNRV